jgi:hypothetical protein
MHNKFYSAQLKMEMEIINDKLPFETGPWRCYMMPDIITIWVLIGMTLQIVEKPLTLAMKIMVLTPPILLPNLITNCTII